MYDAFFNSSAAFMLITEANGDIVDINPSFAEFVGKEKQQVLQQNIKQLLYQSDTPSTLEVFNSILQNNSSLVFENRVINLHGEAKAISWQIQFDTTTNHFFLVGNPLTNNVSLQLFDILGDTLKAGAWQLDINSGQVFCTPQMLKLLGVNKHISEPIYIDDIYLALEAQHQDALQDAINQCSETPCSFELIVELTEAASVSPSESDDKLSLQFIGMTQTDSNKVGHVIGVVQQVSSQSDSSQNPASSSVASKPEAEQLALEEVSKRVAHKINNPLGIISAYTELLLMKDDGSEQEKLSLILESCGQISQIIKDLKHS